MISLIIKKEILQSILTPRFLFLTLLCLVLIPVSLFFNYRAYQTDLAGYRDTVRLHQERLDGEYRRNYEEKLKGFREPSVLMVFARGLQDHFPRSITATPSGPELGKAGTGQEAIEAIIKTVDFHFIVKFIFSLLALLFSFHLISGEKENGTLGLNLANALPRHQLLIGKVLGNILVLTIPFLLSLLLGLLIMSFIGPELVTGNNLARIVLILLGSMLYITTFFMLGLLVTTRTRSSMSALVILLFLWILIIFVVPGVSHILSKIIHPVKSEQVLNLEKDLLHRQIASEKAAALSDLIAVYDANRTQEAWAAYLTAREPIARSFEDQERTQLAQLDKAYWLEKQRQQSVTVFISRISPAPVFSYLTTNFTQTGLAYQNAYQTEAINFNIAMNNEIFNKMWRDEVVTETSRRSIGGYYQSPPLDVTPFSFPSPTIEESLTDVWIDILLLTFYGLVLFAASFVAFLRYDVR